MAMQLDIISFIFGILGSIPLFIDAGLFNELNGVIACFIFLGVAFILYATFAFLINSTRNSRDFVFSYAVSTGCMFVALMMTFIILLQYETRTFCKIGSNRCSRYIFGTILGFFSAAFFMITSILSFKIAHVW